MTENELARALFGRKRREAEEAGSATVVVSATAVESSSGGTVVVDFGSDVFGDTQTVDEQTGEVVYAPPSQGVEVPAAGGISAGDTVSVLVVDNQPVQAIGTGSVDRVGAVADAASTAAQEAKDVAQATGQHFWHDTRGAHVTEEEREDYETEASGFQQLMTSIGTLLTRAVNGVEYLLRSDTQSGMAIYDGTCTADDANLPQHMVASFTTDGAQIGKEGDAHVIIDDDEMTRKVPYVDGQTSGLFDQFKINKDGIEFRPHPRLDTEPSFKLYTPWESWVAQETVTLPSNRQIQFSSFRYQYNSFSRLFYDGQEVPSGYTVYPTYIYVWKTEIPVGASLVVEYNTSSPRTELRLHKNDTSQGRYDDALRVDLNGTKTASITWDGALSCADGSPYCSDGTNVKVGGATVGSADNLSYVASGALFRVELCISPSHTIPANAGATYSYTPTAISGYKPIGVVGFQNDAGWSAIVMGALVSIDEGKVYTVTRNNTSSAVTLKDYIRVLYIRDGFTV